MIGARAGRIAGNHFGRIGFAAAEQLLGPAARVEVERRAVLATRSTGKLRMVVGLASAAAA